MPASRIICSLIIYLNCLCSFSLSVTYECIPISEKKFTIDPVIFRKMRTERLGASLANSEEKINQPVDCWPNSSFQDAINDQWKSNKWLSSFLSFPECLLLWSVNKSNREEESFDKRNFSDSSKNNNYQLNTDHNEHGSCRRKILDKLRESLHSVYNLELLALTFLVDRFVEGSLNSSYHLHIAYDSVWVDSKQSKWIDLIKAISIVHPFKRCSSLTITEFNGSIQTSQNISEQEEVFRQFRKSNVSVVFMRSSGNREELIEDVVKNRKSSHRKAHSIMIQEDEQQSIGSQDKSITMLTIADNLTEAIVCISSSSVDHFSKQSSDDYKRYTIFGMAFAILVSLLACLSKSVMTTLYKRQRIFLDPKLIENNQDIHKVNLGDFSMVVDYRGEKISLSGLDRDIFSISERSWALMSKMQQLRNDNLVSFKGLLESPTSGSVLLAWEHCPRGNLYDIIQQSIINLDWPFKLSLLCDLSNGLKYLHDSGIEKHGWLTSRDCLVNSKWLLKVSNFGLVKLYEQHNFTKFRSKPTSLLWSAPEVIRALPRDGTSFWGSREGDVYSFGIIMSEIMTGKPPFSVVSPEEAEETVSKIIQGSVIRPLVESSDIPPEMFDLMESCLNQNFSMRPKVKEINEVFRKHSAEGDLVESLLQKLERYTNNLETLIKARTFELEEERKKVEKLLYRMLPVPVANSLKMGHIVEPEKFQEATVYFSDIVGFTTISAYSSPIEIITLLNELYTCFDSVIDSYQVYKVETIGDAYVVVSGVPEKRPDHAEQVATMALDILHSCGHFKIKHLPQVPLKLRIGINTGPVVAGIVGQTMPRYCLFGNTVNLASRMESTSKPFGIHISRRTFNRLAQVGGYIMSYRGEVDLKGRGKMSTYWLLGKEGFNKDLPRLENEDGQNHGFKDCEILEIFGAKTSSDGSPGSSTPGLDHL